MDLAKEGQNSWGTGGGEVGSFGLVLISLVRGNKCSSSSFLSGPIAVELQPVTQPYYSLRAHPVSKSKECFSEHEAWSLLPHRKG